MSTEELRLKIILENPARLCRLTVHEHTHTLGSCNNMFILKWDYVNNNIHINHLFNRHQNIVIRIYIVKTRCTPQHISTTYVCCGEHQHMLWTTQKTRHPQHIVTHKIYDEWVLSTTYPHNVCTVSTTCVHPQAMHSTTYDCTPQHTSTTYKTLSTTCSKMNTHATYLLLF